MTLCKKTITLYGSLDAQQQAKAILENHPAVHRIDNAESKYVLKLFLSKRIKDEDIIEILFSSGLDGIQIETGS